MTIYFDVKLNKKKPYRILVYRKERNEKNRQVFKYLGALPSNLDEAVTLFQNKLTDEELFIFENYIETLKFNRHYFHTEADSLTREFIYFAPDFQQSLLEVWKLAKAHNKAFCPREVMLKALFNKMNKLKSELETAKETPKLSSKSSQKKK